MENNFAMDNSNLENSLVGIELDNQCYCDFCMDKLRAENNNDDDNNKEIP